jgi:hypothetical protein
MKIAEFRDVLNRLEELYAAAGAAAPAEDLRSVVRLLEGSESKSVDEFVAETRVLLETQRPADAAAVGLDKARVASHARRLLEAGTNQQAFRAALDALDEDKGLNKAEWYSIADQYRNTPTGGTHNYRYASIKSARAAIRDVFIERFEAESKRGILERITRWAS